MMGATSRICGAGALAGLLFGCSAMDLQLEPRNGAINQQTDNARNNEILLNIVRASRSQPLNFVPISKASGTQTTDFKLGVPTVTIGPGQTLAQHQFVFGSNVWENSSNGSFDSAPLVTRDFYLNMMSPIPLEVINALIHQGISREIILNAMIGAMRIEAPGRVMELKNDPLGEGDSGICPSAAEHYGPAGFLNGSPYSPEHSSFPLQSCEFHYFEFFLQAAMNWGFNVETRSIPNPAYSEAAAKQAKAAGKDAPAKTIMQSRFCFDPAFARPSERAYVMKMSSRCGATVPWNSDGTDQKELTVQFTDGAKTSPRMKFTILPRSPFAVFRYFGHVLRMQETVPVRLYWNDRTLPSEDGRILTVLNSGAFCFAQTSYFSSFYCVPYEGGDGTKQVFALLAQIVALSTSSGSLPTTLEVRLQ